METKYEWNGSMQPLVRRSVRGFEEQASRPLESISVARKGSTENDGEEEAEGSAHVPDHQPVHPKYCAKKERRPSNLFYSL